MKNWQGIPTTRLTLGGEVMVPRDNHTLLFRSELLNNIIPFATQGALLRRASHSPLEASMFVPLEASMRGFGEESTLEGKSGTITSDS